MGAALPEKFDGVSVVLKANVYFDGRVVSHAVVFPDGTKKTLGLIYPGSYSFNTGAPERMSMVSGSCRYRLAGQEEWSDRAAGSHFDVPADSSFDIEVAEGVAEYVCSFG